MIFNFFLFQKDSDASGRGAADKLEARSIDAYWLQRELNNKLFKDPIVSQKKTNEVMEILQVREVQGGWTSHWAANWEKLSRILCDVSCGLCTLMTH